MIQKRSYGLFFIPKRNIRDNKQSTASRGKRTTYYIIM